MASVGKDETEGVGPRTRREPQGSAGTPGAVVRPRAQCPRRRLEKQTGCQGEPYGVAQSQRYSLSVFARSRSRFASRFAIAARLSYFLFPRASPSSTFAYPPRK